MTNLSPAAQAVLNAFLFDWLDEAMLTDRICLANALHAAANQITNTESSDKLHDIADELDDLP